MMRLLFNLFFFIATSLAIHAQNSFYASVQGGIMLGQEQLYANYKDTQNQTWLIDDSKSYALKSPFVGFNLGFLKRINDWGFGVEGSYNHIDCQNKVLREFNDIPYSRNIDVTIQRRFSHKIDLVGKLGYFYKEYFGYGLLGFSKQKIEDYFNGHQTDTALHTQHTIDFKKAKWLSGIVLGLGVERNINDQFKAGIELKYQRLRQSRFNLDPKFSGGNDDELRSIYKKNNMFFIGLKFTYSFFNF